MPSGSKRDRVAWLTGAITAAEKALDGLKAAEDSADPDIAARAQTAGLLRRNEIEDLRFILAIVNSSEEAGWPPLSDNDINQLKKLEDSIDADIVATATASGAIQAMTQVLEAASQIGTILNPQKA